MAGVELLAGLGYLATGVFRYNRENYEFDQEQRFEKEELRLKMQVERFALFREDVRDLVELTVSKMDLYHMVGALFLKACIVYYCEGFWLEAPPVYLLSLYYLSNACSVVYLILGVWLAMHASISSHSYGTKLLTRFIRLPIPGSDEMNTLNARFADFERQGVKQMLRLPFVNRSDGKAKQNDWQQRGELDAPAASSSSGNSPKGKKKDSEYLKDDLKALPHDKDEELLQAVEMRTQRHVNLFRKLQNRWQCYDAYARVCMSLGARQLVQAVTYFLIGITTVENRNYSTVFALVFVLQAVGASISILDISSWPCWKSLDLTLLGWGPGVCASTAWVLTCVGGGRYERVSTALALTTYPLELLWFEMLLRAAAPTDDSASLPRHFRSVMFMDVFAEVDDPTQVDVNTGCRKLTPEERDSAEKALLDAGGALHMAHAAVRRWQALPGTILSDSQVAQRTDARRRLKMTIKDLQKDLMRWGMPPLTPEEVHLRGWEEISVVEREEDPFRNSVLGPLEHQDQRNSTQYYFDLERGEYVTDVRHVRVLGLVDLAEKVRDFEHAVSLVREAAGDHSGATRHEVGADSMTEEEEEHEASPLTRGMSRRHRLQRMGSVQLETDPKKYRDGSAKVQQEKPIRLPWLLVCALTRLAELAWLSSFIMAIVRDVKGVKIDTIEVHIEEDRRLKAIQPLAAQMAALPELAFEQLEVSWPMGAFFRPEALAFMPGQTAEAGGLLVRSPFALYSGDFLPDGRLSTLEEVPGLHFAPGAAAVCGPARAAGASDAAGLPSSRCLLAAPLTGGALGVQLWPWASAQQGGGAAEAYAARIEGAGAWRVLAGASVLCRDAGFPPATDDDWCALLAGWSGGEALSVVTMPLSAGPGSLPREPTGSAWRPIYELPLAPPQEDAAEAPATSAGLRDVAALHLEPEAGRLWALLQSGELAAWALLPGAPRFLGRWSVPASMGNQSFQAAAVCEDPAGRGLLVAGRTDAAAGLAGGPVLLRAAALPALL